MVIAPGFADIFYNNSLKNGLLPVVLGETTINRLFDAVKMAPGYTLRVNLEDQTVTTPGNEILEFHIDPFRKQCLLQGLDEIGLTLRHADKIRAYEARRRSEAPWLFLRRNIQVK